VRWPSDGLGGSVGVPSKEAVMRAPLKALSATVVLAACLAGGGIAASAAPPDVGHFSGTDTFPPALVTDLPCLEGTAFIASGSVDFRGTFVNSPTFFHFAGTERFSTTLVPVGEGLTYVERGSIDRTVFTARVVDGGINVLQNHINNDNFFGFDENGKLVASATIRVHELTHFVGVDTNGDNVPDQFKVSIDVDDVSCPA
jgi:hypothetical protein